MKHVSKSIQAMLVLMTVIALSGCSLGQAAAPTPTTVDVNAIMTASSGTALAQLTIIAGQATATVPPTAKPTETPTLSAAATSAQGTGGTATQNPVTLLTATESAGGLPPTANATTATGGLPLGTAAPSLTPLVPVVVGGATVDLCYNAKFVEDVTIPDGTVFKPDEYFTKIWRVENTGNCKWDQGFGLVLWAGPAMDSHAIYFSGHDKEINPGGIIDLPVDMRAPSEAGEYVAHWKMINDQGVIFGGDFTVFIKVVK